jgi:Domain of unknown function (DUF6471)
MPAPQQSDENSTTVLRTEPGTKAEAKQLIRAELKRRDLGYADLAKRMEAIGLKVNNRPLANKIASGGFSAVFFFQCMEAIGVQNIHLNGD